MGISFISNLLSFFLSPKPLQLKVITEKVFPEKLFGPGLISMFWQIKNIRMVCERILIVLIDLFKQLYVISFVIQL
jgi:hypothetical protein